MGGAREKFEKGELRRELAYFLILLSQPQKEDVVLDPFAGSGAIVLSRVSHFPYKAMTGGDIKSEKVEDLKKKTRWGYPKIKIEKVDALKLVDIDDNSIDKIITDPPWGEFEKPQEDMINFYRQMLAEFFRVLRPEGKVVILVGRNSGFEMALTDSNFLVEKKLNVLVSGKKACVYCLVR